MPNYKRYPVKGGTYFFTQVVYNRSQPWLCKDSSRRLLREAIIHVRKKYPFSIEAIVLLPDHLHCIWKLPDTDSDFSTRWRLIKTYVTKNYKDWFEPEKEISNSRRKRNERNFWQRRFWEHTIRDENEFKAYVDYIHYNPVKHGYCEMPAQWTYSSFDRYVSLGVYSKSWGPKEAPPIDIEKEFE